MDFEPWSPRVIALEKFWDHFPSVEFIRPPRILLVKEKKVAKIPAKKEGNWLADDPIKQHAPNSASKIRPFPQPASLSNPSGTAKMAAISKVKPAANRANLQTERAILSLIKIIFQL